MKRTIKIYFPILALCLLGGATYLTMALISQITRKESDMSTKYPVEVNQQSDQPSPPPSDGVDERIAWVENGLVCMSADGQPQ